MRVVDIRGFPAASRLSRSQPRQVPGRDCPHASARALSGGGVQQCADDPCPQREGLVLVAGDVGVGGLAEGALVKKFRTSQQALHSGPYDQRKISRV